MSEALDDMLERKLAEVQHSIALLKAQESVLLELMGHPQPKPRAQHSTVKPIILSLLEAAGENGTDATAICAQAKTQYGQKLIRSTVSSMLSRLKADGIATYDGEVYRLAERRVPTPTDPTS